MDPQESLKELPANLKTSLLLYSYYGMIKNIRLLQLDANFTASILTHLKLLKLKKGETLYRQDDPAEEVFFISKGSVKLVNEFGQSIYAFTEGTYFGEVETIEDVPENWDFFCIYIKNFRRREYRFVKQQRIQSYCFVVAIISLKPYKTSPQSKCR